MSREVEDEGKYRRAQRMFSCPNCSCDVICNNVEVWAKPLIVSTFLANNQCIHGESAE